MLLSLVDDQFLIDPSHVVNMLPIPRDFSVSIQLLNVIVNFSLFAITLGLRVSFLLASLGVCVCALFFSLSFCF